MSKTSEWARQEAEFKKGTDFDDSGYDTWVLEQVIDQCTTVNPDDLFYEHLIKTHGKCVEIAGVNRNIAEVLSQLGEYDDMLEEWTKNNEDLIEFQSNFYLKSDVDFEVEYFKANYKPTEPLDFTGATEGDR